MILPNLIKSNKNFTKLYDQPKLLSWQNKYQFTLPQKNPEISDLIQCTIYSDLIDGENTHKAHNVQYILFVIKITGFSAR